MEETHAFFITWSYIGVGVLTLGLIAYVIWDSIRVKQKLQKLEGLFFGGATGWTCAGAACGARGRRGSVDAPAASARAWQRLGSWRTFSVS